MNPDAVYDFASAIALAISPVPLILKVGVFPSREAMKKVFLAAARAGVRAICGINSLSLPVVNAQDAPALGPHRKTSGICGEAIRPEALQFMLDASSINREDKLQLTLLGCGGLMLPEHLASMLDAGATIAMSATAMMWDPLLAMRYLRNYANHR